MTETDAALLGSALTAPYDNLMAFNGRQPPHNGLFTFLMHAFANEADIPWDRTRCMKGIVQRIKLLTSPTLTAIHMLLLATCSIVSEHLTILVLLEALLQIDACCHVLACNVTWRQASHRASDIRLNLCGAVPGQYICNNFEILRCELASYRGTSRHYTSEYRQ